MAYVTTNNTDLSYIEETVPGTTPTTPAFQLLPYTGGAPEFAYTTEVSEAISGQRGRDDLIVTNAEVTASISFELSYDAYKPFLIEVLRSPDAGPYGDGSETPTTYTFLKRVNDGGTYYYYYYTGCVVKSVQLDFSNNSRITGTMTLVGRAENATDTQVAGSTYTLVPSYTVMNTSSNVDTLTVGGNSYCTTSMTLTFENNSTGATCIGTLGASDVNDFSFDVMADLEIYFEQQTEYAKFKAATSFAMAVGLTDTDGNEIDISLPRCKYESMTIPVSGRDQYLMIPASVRALYDTVSGYTAEMTFTDA